MNIRLFITFLLLTTYPKTSCNDFKLTEGKLSDTPFEISKIDSLADNILQGGYGDIHSLLIIHNNELVLEKYFGVIEKDQLQPCQSITKSITSILIGIAIDKGYIKSINDRILDYLPDYANKIQNKDTLKSLITIKDGLKMTTGLRWNEEKVSADDENNQVHIMNRQPDLIKYALDQPMDTTPGKVYNYNSGIAVVLGHVLKNATGMDVDKFAEKFLFKPLDIDTYEWSKPNGQTHTGGGLALQSKDLAKIGLLYINNGKYGGNQIVSKSWIEQTYSSRIEMVGPYYRGLGWIIIKSDYDFEILAAAGFGGQAIFIIPEFKTVIVETAWNTGPDGVLRSVDILKQILFTRPDVKEKVINLYNQVKNYKVDSISEYKMRTLGMDLLLCKEYNKAIDIFAKSILKYGEKHQTYYCLSKASFEIMDYDKARFYINKAIILNPNKSYNDSMDMIVAKELNDKINKHK